MERTKQPKGITETKKPEQYGFFKSYQILYEYFGYEAGGFLCYLIDKYGYRKKTKTLKDQKWFYITYDDMWKEIKISKFKASSIASLLESKGAIKTKMMMRPQKKYYSINWNITINPQSLSSLTVKELNYYSLRNLTINRKETLRINIHTTKQPKNINPSKEEINIIEEASIKNKPKLIVDDGKHYYLRPDGKYRNKAGSIYIE